MSLTEVIGGRAPGLADLPDAIGPAARSEAPVLSRARPLRRRLRDGTPVRLRLIDARDRERLRAGFRHLSPESRYRRFFTPVPRLTETMLERLTATDERDHVAVGAERGGVALGRRAGLGVARFIRLADRPDTAEIALAVIDDMQGRGLGRLLLETLCWVARERGVDRFRAMVLPGNVAMQELLRELDPELRTSLEDGLQTYDLTVPDRDLDRIGRSSSRGFLDLAVDALTLAGEQLRLPAAVRRLARL